MPNTALESYIRRTMSLTEGKKGPKVALRPLLALNQPFTPQMSAPAPAYRTGIDDPASMNVPESATLVGDETGKPYARMGDNPNGQETLTVTPPGGPSGGATIRPPMDEEHLRQLSYGGGEQGAYQSGLDAFTKGLPVADEWLATYGKGQKPVSMAYGGIATIGGVGGYLTPEEEARKRLEEEQGIQDAAFNMEDKGTVALAQTLRNSTDYQYGRAGVAAPTAVIRPKGATGTLMPGTREAYQTEEQRLTDQASRDQRMRSLQAATQPSIGGYGSAAAPPRAPAQRSRSTNTGTSGVDALQAARYGTGAAGAATGTSSALNQYAQQQIDAQDPVKQEAARKKELLQQAIAKTGRTDFSWDPEGNDGKGEYVTAADMRVRAAGRPVEFDEVTGTYRPKGELLKENLGKVAYLDPYGGGTKYLTPHEANLSKAAYADELKKALAKSANVPTFGDLGADELMGYIREGLLTDPAQIDVVKEALRFKGLSNPSIDLKIHDAQEDAKEAAAAKAYTEAQRAKAALPDVKTFSVTDIAQLVQDNKMDLLEGYRRLEAMGYGHEEAIRKLDLERSQVKTESEIDRLIKAAEAKAAAKK